MPSPALYLSPPALLFPYLTLSLALLPFITFYCLTFYFSSLPFLPIRPPLSSPKPPLYHRIMSLPAHTSSYSPSFPLQSLLSSIPIQPLPLPNIPLSPLFNLPPPPHPPQFSNIFLSPLTPPTSLCPLSPPLSPLSNATPLPIPSQHNPFPLYHPPALPQPPHYSVTMFPPPSLPLPLTYKWPPYTS